MKKLLFIVALAATFSVSAKDNKQVFTSDINEIVMPKVKTQASASEKDAEVCRICVTISVKDKYGNLTGLSACAGNLFTDCETAAQKASLKVAQKALNIMADIN